MELKCKLSCVRDVEVMMDIIVELLTKNSVDLSLILPMMRGVKVRTACILQTCISSLFPAKDLCQAVKYHNTRHS